MSVRMLAGACVLPLIVCVAGCGKPQAPSQSAESQSSAQSAASEPIQAEAAPSWVYPALRPPAPPSKTPHAAADKGPPTTLAVDLFPTEHPTMPPAVRGGGKTVGCGYCHLPTGGGRPENISLAGLPYAYLAQQASDMKAGLRQAQPDYSPGATMIKTIKQVPADALDQALHYFSAQAYVKHVKVVETDVIPHAAPANFVYKFDKAAPSEPLGQRIIEGPDDFEQFEKRDPHTAYTAYVPLGAVARGAQLAQGTTARPACASCHGADLRGGQVGPPIAGRFATGLLRQLYAFRTGARNGAGAVAMKPVVAGLSQADMIDLAAYVASRQP